MNILIGTFLFTSQNNAIKVALTFEYYKTDTDIIVGGKKNIKINGIVSIGDDGSETGRKVMSQLKEIRDIGKKNQCITVDIPKIHSGSARIVNVSIDQGSDPTWVNQGAFSIDIEAPLDSIPPNSYGITHTDYIKSLSFSEKINLGDDSHGFVYSDNALSKAFVEFDCTVSLEIDTICQNIDSKNLLENNIRKFIKNGPTHKLLQQYKSWRIYLQDRSYDISNNGNSATLTIKSILLPPKTRNVDAAVDLNFKHSKTYDSGEENKTISGNIKGLVVMPWEDIIDIESIHSTSKLDSAESALQYIKSRLSDITSWDGIDRELFRYDCPPGQPDTIEKSDCLKPSTSSIQKSRTEGSIDFTFEWLSGDCPKNNKSCASIEYQVDDQKSSPTINEFTIPTIQFNADPKASSIISRFSQPISAGGILMQNINCRTARRITFTSNLNFPDNICPDQPYNDEYQQYPRLNSYRNDYFRSIGASASDFILIEHTFNRSNRAHSIKQSFISVCQNV